MATFWKRAGTSASVVVPAALTASIAVGILAELLLAGRDGMWGLPTSIVSGEAWVRGALSTAVLAAALYVFEILDRRTAPAARRRALQSVVVIALALALDLLAVDSHIGDWQVVLRITESGALIGKWYLVSAVFGAFHSTIGALAGFSPETSARLVASLAGAATSFVYFRVVDRLGLPAVFRGWPFLYAGCFAVTAVGAGHLEIYSLVALECAGLAWAGLRLVDSGSAGDGLLLALLIGLGLAGYIGIFLLIPAIVILLAAVAWRVRPFRRPRFWVAAAAGVALVVGLAVLPPLLGPAPIDESMGAKLSRPFHWETRPRIDRTPTPVYQPEDAHATFFAYALAPRYWLDGWRLADLLQHLLLDDRSGLFLFAGLGLVLGIAFARGRMRSRAAPSGALGLLFLVAAAASVLAFAATVLNGIPYPWDWDLFSYGFVFVSFAAAGLIAGAANGRPIRGAALPLAAAAALLAQVQGASFLLDCARAPAEFGPPVDGLSAAVGPPEMTIAPGRSTLLWVWLRNQGATTVTFRDPTLEYRMAASSADGLLREESARGRRLRRTIAIPPGRTTCITWFLYEPAPLLASPPYPAQAEWRRPLESGFERRYTARWFVAVRSGASPGPTGDETAPYLEAPPVGLFLTHGVVR